MVISKYLVFSEYVAKEEKLERFFLFLCLDQIRRQFNFSSEDSKWEVN